MQIIATNILIKFPMVNFSSSNNNPYEFNSQNSPYGYNPQNASYEFNPQHSKYEGGSFYRGKFF